MSIELQIDFTMSKIISLKGGGGEVVPTAVYVLILRIIIYNRCLSPFVFNKIFRFEFVAVVGIRRPR